MAVGNGYKSGVMEIEYRELKTDQDFEQCIEIQKSVFGFSERELVSPLFFKLIARDVPPIGSGMGVFRKNEDSDELLGFILGFATYLESSIYVVLLAIRKENQNGVFGYKLLFNYRELLLSKGINKLIGVYEPLEANLGRLYCHSLGYYGIKYMPDTTMSAFPSDKIYVIWELSSNHVLNRIQRKVRTNPEEALLNIPLVNRDFSLDNEQLLVEIPENYLELKQHDPQKAFEWRTLTRNTFNKYINERNYIIIDCIFSKTTTGKRYFYILEKSIKENEGSN